MIGPLMESLRVPISPPETNDPGIVVHDKKLIAGNYSEPPHRGFVGKKTVPLTRARRVAAAIASPGARPLRRCWRPPDYCAVMAYQNKTTAPTAAMILFVPRQAAGQRIEEVRDTLGMRATQSDRMVLDECLVADDALMVPADNIVPFRRGSRGLVVGPRTPPCLSASPSRGTRPSIEAIQREERSPASPGPSPIIRTSHRHISRE